MPKQQPKTETEFNKEKWLGTVKEKIMRGPWESGRLWTDGVLTMEVVRVGETEDVMVRIRTPNVRNAIKLTRKEHISALLMLAEAVARNENNIKDKLEALRELFKARTRAAEEEF